MSPPASDPVQNEVLKLIVQMQRDQNDALDEIKSGVSGIRTDLALQARDVSELKLWRQVTVDPALSTFHAGVNRAKGGLSGLKLGVALGAASVGGGAIAALSGAGKAVLLAMVRVLQ